MNKQLAGFIAFIIVGSIALIGYYFARPAYPAPGVSATPRAVMSKGA